MTRVIEVVRRGRQGRAGAVNTIAKYESLAVNTALLNADFGSAYRATAAITVTLPVEVDAAWSAIIDADGGAVTLAATGLINGSADDLVIQQGFTTFIYSDGTNFFARFYFAEAFPIANAADSAAAALASENAAAADAVATAADRVQTGLDVVATAADAAATAADRVQTGLDRVQTGEDRTQTGLDRAATEAAASSSWLSGRNAIINGNFAVNQRGVSGTVTLAAGAYGHDRWKAGASGCTYTFAKSANVTTLTITAGSLLQVIEGVNLSSGTHVLSWTGTAQGKIGAGSYSASGVTGTATGVTNLNIEFNTGTVSRVQFEKGSVVTPFERRPIGAELALCQRYFWREIVIIYSSTATNIKYPVTMRANPTITGGGAGFSVLYSGYFGNAWASQTSLSAQELLADAEL